MYYHWRETATKKENQKKKRELGRFEERTSSKKAV